MSKRKRAAMEEGELEEAQTDKPYKRRRLNKKRRKARKRWRKMRRRIRRRRRKRRKKRKRRKAIRMMLQLLVMSTNQESNDDESSDTESSDCNSSSIDSDEDSYEVYDADTETVDSDENNDIDSDEDGECRADVVSKKSSGYDKDADDSNFMRLINNDKNDTAIAIDSHDDYVKRGDGLVEIDSNVCTII